MIDKNLAIAFGLLVVFSTLTIISLQAGPGSISQDRPSDGTVVSFESASEFQEYLDAVAAQRSGTFNTFTTAMRTDTVMMESAAPQTTTGMADDGAQVQPSRYSETNVQVQGIDEPDIVKTDGNRIYYSSQNYWTGQNTTIIDAFPLEDLDIADSIKESGQLLLHNNEKLVVLTDSWQDRKLTTYDVTGDRPEKSWEAELNGTISMARLYDGQLYVVVREQIDYDVPCPIRPMTIGGDRISVPCTDIWHPSRPVNADVTYTVLAIDPDTGDVSDATSFVADSRYATVSMFQGAIYVATTWQKPTSELYLEFLTGPGTDLVDEETADRMQQIQDLDISQQAKLVEVQYRLDEYRRTLSRDARRTFETELQNALGNYSEERMREFERTTITKIGVSDGLRVETTGEVPGHLLNQFSMDEYDGNLRVATTVRPVMWRGESENDVYVLDADMDQIGAVTGMGLNEQIYSVRFIGDNGYVVTFRRIDPFHVLDLSDPADPRLEGELKLPGFSSYLHPIGEDLILGIGEEERQVKAVVFDVSDPTDPTVAADYLLDETWSAIRSTHHAFLYDDKHNVFFVPGGNGGYVMSYQDGEIELETAVDIDNAQRALYIDDYLYVIGTSEITVIDENSWERVETLKLPQYQPKPVPLPEPWIR